LEGRYRVFFGVGQHTHNVDGLRGGVRKAYIRYFAVDVGTAAELQVAMVVADTVIAADNVGVAADGKACVRRGVLDAVTAAADGASGDSGSAGEVGDTVVTSICGTDTAIVDVDGAYIVVDAKVKVACGGADAATIDINGAVAVVDAIAYVARSTDAATIDINGAVEVVDSLAKGVCAIGYYAARFFFGTVTDIQRCTGTDLDDIICAVCAV